MKDWTGRPGLTQSEGCSCWEVVRGLARRLCMHPFGAPIARHPHKNFNAEWSDGKRGVMVMAKGKCGSVEVWTCGSVMSAGSAMPPMVLAVE